jgi:hypothetical protein
VVQHWFYMLSLAELNMNAIMPRVWDLTSHISLSRHLTGYWSRPLVATLARTLPARARAREQGQPSVKSGQIQGKSHRASDFVYFAIFMIVPKKRLIFIIQCSVPWSSILSWDLETPSHLYFSSQVETHLHFQLQLPGCRLNRRVGRSLGTLRFVC